MQENAQCSLMYMPIDCIYIPYSMEMVFVALKFDNSHRPQSHRFLYISTNIRVLACLLISFTYVGE